LHGGSITEDNQNTTHFVINNKGAQILENEYKEFNLRLKSQYKVNIKYIFHSYFYLTRMPETEEEYTKPYD
jgi:hypothetical protein